MTMSANTNTNVATLAALKQIFDIQPQCWDRILMVVPPYQGHDEIFPTPTVGVTRCLMVEMWSRTLQAPKHLLSEKVAWVCKAIFLETTMPNAPSVNERSGVSDFKPPPSSFLVGAPHIGHSYSGASILIPV